MVVREGIDQAVKLFSNCKGRYASLIQISVICVENSVPGFLVPGLIVHYNSIYIMQCRPLSQQDIIWCVIEFLARKGFM